MWPFSRGRVARQKAYIREAFGPFLSSALIEQLASRPGDLPLMPLENRKIVFALLQIRDDDPAALAERLGRAVDVAAEAQGMVDIMAPFVAVIFGVPLTDEPGKLRSLRQRMIENLLNNCGRDIRIVYGEADGLAGNLGSERRFTYSAAIPRLGAAFQRLMTLEFGLASEVVL